MWTYANNEILGEVEVAATVGGVSPGLYSVRYIVQEFPEVHHARGWDEAERLFRVVGVERSDGRAMPSELWPVFEELIGG